MHASIIHEILTSRIVYVSEVSTHFHTKIIFPHNFFLRVILMRDVGEKRVNNDVMHGLWWRVSRIKKKPDRVHFIWYVTLLCDFQENVADEKWWIFHNVDIISILSVWAISNSSLYRGYQLFHVAYIHSRVVKRKKKY